MDNVLNFGDAIRAIRKEKGISQRELARRINMPVTTYSNYENGQRIFKRSQLNSIADVLNIKYSDIINRALSMEVKFSETASASEDENIRVVTALNHLNDDGKTVLAGIAEALETTQKYQACTLEC